MTGWSLAHRAWLLVVLLLTIPALAADRHLALDVELNGKPAGLMIELTRRGDDLLAAAADLRDIGLKVDQPDADLVSLKSLPGLTAQVNMRKQILVLTAPSGLLRPTVVGLQHPRLAPLTSPEWASLFSYDVLTTASRGGNSINAAPEMRLLSPYGTLTTDGIVTTNGGTNGSTNGGTSSGRIQAERLNTWWSIGEPDSLRLWQAGDLIEGGLAWSRPLRLGGGQVSTDFGMRPDLLTFASPSFAGQAAVPSTVDVLVNGIRQLSQPVPAGPFEIPSMPAVTGTGDIAVAVRDSLGRETLVTLPFYTSATLLAEGLTSYSFEGGPIRLGYGTATTRYVSWAASGTARHGLTDWLTLEAHSEGTAGLALAGGGAALRVGGLGVVSLDLAGSNGNGTAPGTVSNALSGQSVRLPGPPTGMLGSVGIQQNTQYYQFSGSFTKANDGWRDVAALYGSAPIRRASVVSFGLPLWRIGTLSASWITQSTSAIGILPAQRQSVVNLSYTVNLGHGVSLAATGFNDLSERNGVGFLIGLTVVLGPRDFASVSGGWQTGKPLWGGQVQRSVSQPGELGGMLQNEQSGTVQRLGRVDYMGDWGTVAVAAEQSGQSEIVQGDLTGSVALAGGGVTLANRVTDSFAVVRTGEEGGVPVLYENRLVGTTDSFGRLLVPYLRSWENNRLAIDATNLPADVEVGETTRIVRPEGQTDVVVDFKVRPSHGAVIKLRLADGKPVPRGAVLDRPGQEPVLVGRDGRAYLTGLEPKNHFTVELPDESKCSGDFVYAARRGDIPMIGPVVCQ